MKRLWRYLRGQDIYNDTGSVLSGSWQGYAMNIGAQPATIVVGDEAELERASGTVSVERRLPRDWKHPLI